MSTATQRTGAQRPVTRSKHGTVKDLGLGFVQLTLVAVATWWLFDLRANYLVQCVGLFAILSALLMTAKGGSPKGSGLGAANRVTLGRAALVLPMAALLTVPLVQSPGGQWWIIFLGTAAAILDGVDGWVARRTDSASAFGARFDMELDAFMVLVLSVLVWQSGKVGAWVILIGAMRYLFVAAAWIWPALSNELPPSQRRKVACVVQVVVLLVCLGPIIPDLMAVTVAAGALALLTYSFAVDVAWLVWAARGSSR